MQFQYRSTRLFLFGSYFPDLKAFVLFWALKIAQKAYFWPKTLDLVQNLKFTPHFYISGLELTALIDLYMKICIWTRFYVILNRPQPPIVLHRNLLQYY